MYLKSVHTSSVVSVVKVVWTSSLYVGDKNAHGIVEEKHLGELTEVFLVHWYGAVVVVLELKSHCV
jgi:hypothetical protein